MEQSLVTSEKKAIKELEDLCIPVKFYYNTNKKGHVYELNLSDTGLSEIPDCINEFSQLRILNLSTKLRKDVLNATKPPENEILKIQNISNLKNLKTLNISCNKIKKIEGIPEAL